MVSRETFFESSESAAFLAALETEYLAAPTVRQRAADRRAYKRSPEYIAELVARPRRAPATKEISRAYALTYLRRGILKREPCQECGSPQSEIHHPDYTKPLLVRWLCRPCRRAAEA
jgi:hypothetical protein